MQCQLIQNFINLPGIIGFSLTSSNQDKSPARIYSAGFTQGRRPEQSPLLMQGIQQIIQTTPASLEYCTFQFGLYQVELHKVENGAILLIMSQGKLSDQHSKAVKELMHFIKADYTTLVASLQTINTDDRQGASNQSTEQVPIIPMDDLLVAMNQASQVARRYLGPRLVAEHWRASQSPTLTWMKQFEIAADGTLSIAENTPALTPEQLTEVQFWMQRFRQRCTRFIRDYDTLVAQSLPKHHWQLLFGD